MGRFHTCQNQPNVQPVAVEIWKQDMSDGPEKRKRHRVAFTREVAVRMEPTVRDVGRRGRWSEAITQRFCRIAAPEGVFPGSLDNWNRISPM
jgi:hypothetical protein